MAKFGVLGLLPSKIPKPFLITLNNGFSLHVRFFLFLSFDWDTRTTILIQIWFVTFGCACCMLKTRRIVTRCFLQCVDSVETTVEMASIETKRAILICQNERKENAEADGEKRIFDKCQREKKKNKTPRRKKKIVNDLFRRRTCLMKNPFYNCTWPEKTHTRNLFNPSQKWWKAATLKEKSSTMNMDLPYLPRDLHINFSTVKSYHF